MMGQLTKQFGKIKVEVEIPHLLNLQVDSYRKFMQEGRTERLPDEGLEGVFRSVFPIEDFNRTASLEFVSYEVGEPKYDQAECISKGLTYESPVRIKVRLVVYDVDDETEARTVRDIKEQDIYFGTLPLMTEKGTFIINGTERVIVNQLQRSPGIIFEHDGGKTHTSRKVLYSCRVIPMRGSWLDFDFDHKDILYVRIDRRRKMPATILLKAMGMSKTEILDCFYKKEIYELEDDGRVSWHFNPELHRKEAAFADIVDKEGNVLVKAGKPITKRAWRQMEAAGVEKIEVAPETPLGLFLAEDLVDNATGEILAEAADEITAGLFDACREAGITTISALHTRGTDTSSSIRDTLVQDKTPTMEKAQEEIYRRLRPSSPPTPEIAASFFDNLFRNGDYYDLSPVGRYKLNQRLNKTDHADLRTLADDDILDAIKVLVQLKDSHGPADDIDHLGNRRVRLVGELVENQYRIGLVRMERAIKERMSIQEVATLMPHDLINPKPVAAVLKEFFGTSQLSQFMDQTNSLSEVTHKRRLSALGPGGLTRERAGFEVRDVHVSHYGRICPIETPEGPNIGLISSLSNYGIINKYGLIETPYRQIVDGKVTNECKYVTADIEEDKIIAQASEPLDAEGYFVHKNVASRRGADVLEAEPDEVDLMDVSPKQVVSIGTSLIPFLEHDDTNRALMGANMQRQAVPLLRPEAPLVGTGMEWVAGQDSGVCILAKRGGTVERVTGRQIIVRADNGELDTYDLIKFMRSNQSTCINQRPVVFKGDRVEVGSTLADGMATDGGELALGHNVLVAFVSWEGYNHEDAVLISERLCKDDLYTSIHIEEYECDARDTKLGAEEITRQLSSVSEDAVKYLDENGIIMIGADVRPGDILVGKVTPKGETELTPEERLLRAIFGDKEREVRDTSLRVPHGEFGKVVDVKVFTRENGDELAPGVNKLVRVYIAQKRKIREGDKMAGRHGNKCVCSRILPVEDMPFTPDGRPVDLVLNPLGVPSRMNIGQILEIHLSWACHMLGEEIHEALKDPAQYKIMEQRLRDCGYDFDQYGMPEPTESGIHIATPVFDGCRDEDLAATLKAAGLPANAKTDLYDGRTGEKLDNQVTIGWKYMLKLHHLVDDKIHARSTGPYSLVTQQPLGGKAQFGGQRFGEMEVWALEAYGAAYTLQEILTVKSDDVIGRVKAYEKIFKGENIPSPGVPESFKVLMKELQSIGLDVRILNENGDEVVLKELDEEDMEQGYGGGERWHRDEVKEAMEGDTAVTESRNAMESYMTGAPAESLHDDVASFNDALEAEVTAPAYEEAGFNEEELNGDSGHDDDRDE